MSAFIVDKKDIDTLVTAACSVLGHDSGMRWWDCDAVTLRTDGDWKAHQREIRYSDSERQNEIGRMLWLENLKSIEFRYPDTIENHDYPGPIAFEGTETIADYRYAVSRITSPLEILHRIDSYEYQTCEHDGWPASEAASFCESLRRKQIHRLYDEHAARR